MVPHGRGRGPSDCRWCHILNRRINQAEENAWCKQYVSHRQREAGGNTFSIAKTKQAQVQPENQQLIGHTTRTPNKNETTTATSHERSQAEPRQMQVLVPRRLVDHLHVLCHAVLMADDFIVASSQEQVVLAHSECGSALGSWLGFEFQLEAQLFGFVSRSTSVGFVLFGRRDDWML